MNDIIIFLSSPIWYLIIFIEIIFIIACNIFYPKIIGWFGEYWTKQELNRLPKDKYVILNDIMIMTGDYTSQIDHIVVSKYGLFVIETKQYNGYITGNKYDKKWVRHGKKKTYYTNPIKQNYGHVKSICKLLNLDETKVFNIVCVPSKAILKIQDDGEVVRYDTIYNKIISYNTEIINNIDEIVNNINKNKITDRRVRRKHIKNIEEKNKGFGINRCPKCGGDLISRNGKYGEFLGCSNYPKCKYTKSLKE